MTRLGISAACLMLSAAPASAGYWNYGCKGSLDDKTAVVFDRNAFLIMPKELAKGDIAGLVKDEIFTFDAADNNSGFQSVMKFSRGAFPDQKIELIEKASKTISEAHGNVGTREKSTVISKKTYHFTRYGYADQPTQADIAMDCIEYEMSAP
jgi:hypothetical protein